MIASDLTNQPEIRTCESISIESEPYLEWRESNKSISGFPEDEIEILPDEDFFDVLLQVEKENDQSDYTGVDRDAAIMYSDQGLVLQSVTTELFSAQQVVKPAQKKTGHQRRKPKKQGKHNATTRGTTAKCRQSGRLAGIGTRAGRNVSQARSRQLPKIRVAAPRTQTRVPSDDLNALKTTRKKKASMRFYERLNDLDGYRAYFGHCNVPQSVPVLGTWVNKMRQQKRNLDSGKRSSLDTKMVALLEKLGFDWGKQKGEDLWNKHFMQLKEFYSKEGHCKVPTRNYKPNSSLGRWVSDMRCKYKQLQNGEKSTLTDEQIARLNSIGFCWEMHTLKSQDN